MKNFFNFDFKELNYLYNRTLHTAHYVLEKQQKALKIKKKMIINNRKKHSRGH